MKVTKENYFYSHNGRNIKEKKKHKQIKMS